MSTVLERKTIEKTEQQQHNAQISERYRMLLNAVEGQFAAPTKTPSMENPAHIQYEETPEATQTPEVIAYSPVFVTAGAKQAEPVRRVEGSIAQKNVVAAHTSMEYSFSPLAKAMLVAVAVIVSVMLILVGVNSAIIRQRKVRLRNLETEKQEVLDENNEIAKYIQDLKSVENILKNAEELGIKIAG